MFLETFGISDKKVSVVLSKKEILNYCHKHTGMKSDNILGGPVNEKIIEHLKKMPTVHCTVTLQAEVYFQTVLRTWDDSSKT